MAKYYYVLLIISSFAIDENNEEDYLIQNKNLELKKMALSRIKNDFDLKAFFKNAEKSDIEIVELDHDNELRLPDELSDNTDELKRKIFPGYVNHHHLCKFSRSC